MAIGLGAITYTTVTWTTGDTITEAKKDNEVANSQAYDAHAAQGILFNNEIGLFGKNSSGTNRLSIGRNASDNVEIGDAAEGGLIQLNEVWDSSVQPATRVTDTSNQSINDSTQTAINWDTETFDIGGQHDNVTNNNRLTIQKDGLYLINAGVEFADNGTGFRQLGIRVDGSTFISLQTQRAFAGSGLKIAVSLLYDLTATQYIETMVYQTSGAPLNALTTTAYAYFGLFKIA